MSAILLDIEGTTTPVTFVFDVLFPYARQHAADYLRARWDSAELAACAAAFAEQVRSDEWGAPLEGSAAQQRQALLSNALIYMDQDRKVTCLKSLQGLIWRDGYQAGKLRGEVYDDVPTALQTWKARARAVAIYSSGSVEAQQLLFRHSTHGDLSGFMSGWFDTTTGPKREAASYARIAERLGLTPGAITFATDVVEEALAARAAGLHAVIIRRPGNAPLPPHDFAEHPTLLEATC